MATTLLAVALSGCGGSEGPAAATPVANEPAAIDAARHPALLVAAVVASLVAEPFEMDALRVEASSCFAAAPRPGPG